MVQTKSNHNGKETAIEKAAILPSRTQPAKQDDNAEEAEQRKRPPPL